MFQNLIFDWSGTLVDDLGPVIEATNATLAHYKHPPFTRESFRREFRLPYQEFYAELLPGVSLPELEEHFRPAFAAAKSPVTILPHSLETLSIAHARGVRMFVLTSMDPKAFEIQLRQFSLGEYFEATYAGVLDKRKIIREILTEHSLEKSQTAFIGDMTHDIDTAHHGGITSIAVLTGYQDPEIIATARPDITVSDLQFIQKLLGLGPSPRPIATVGALIYNEAGEVLLIRTHKWSHKWAIPGGKIEHAENIEAALIREISEETGLSITNLKFILTQESINSAEFFRPAHFILINYIAKAASTQVTLNNEAQAYQWLNPTEALCLDLNEPTRFLLEKAISQNLIPPPADGPN